MPPRRAGHFRERTQGADRHALRGADAGISAAGKLDCLELGHFGAVLCQPEPFVSFWDSLSRALTGYVATTVPGCKVFFVRRWGEGVGYLPPPSKTLGATYRHRIFIMANDNTVVVKLGDEEIVLKPRVEAMRAISRQFNGLKLARDAIVAENFDAVAAIIRIGSGMRDREARDLDDKIFAEGLTGDLLVGLINYVAMLGNKGQPVTLGMEEDPKKETSEHKYD